MLSHDPEPVEGRGLRLPVAPDLGYSADRPEALSYPGTGETPVPLICEIQSVNLRTI